MNSFTEEERIIALNKAIKKIRRIKKTSVGYCYGISDCWTLFCEYDNFLRNNSEKLKKMFIGYKTQEEWFETLKTTHGFSSPKALLIAHSWEPVPFEETVLGDMSAFSYANDKDMWSAALKVNPLQWYSSSNLPDLDVLKDRFVRKNLNFTLRAVK